MCFDLHVSSSVSNFSRYSSTVRILFPSSFHVHDRVLSAPRDTYRSIDLHRSSAIRYSLFLMIQSVRCVFDGLGLRFVTGLPHRLDPSVISAVRSRPDTVPSVTTFRADAGFLKGSHDDLRNCSILKFEEIVSNNEKRNQDFSPFEIVFGPFQNPSNRPEGIQLIYFQNHRISRENIVQRLA